MFARNFLQKWGDWEFTQPSNWNGADNGVLQVNFTIVFRVYKNYEILTNSHNDH